MNKKALLAFFAFIFAIFIFNFASAANVGYVVKTPSPLSSDEITIKGLLIDAGHSVTILDDIAFNASAYDIIIVGEDVTDINGIFDNKNHKTLFLSSTAAKNAGLSKYSGTTTSNKITISDNNHIITEFFSLGDLTVQDSLETVGYLDGCGAINSQSLAYKTYDYRKVILILRENSLLLDASESCSRRTIPIYERNIFFGLPRASNWNFNSEDLFINSINWLIEGEDIDEDGYYYDEDCNDNDANKWQLLKGYLDNDNDGYGTEALIDACSGEELAQGYSNINGDCNDNNNAINPDENEMQYDGIDQNCDNAAEFSDEIPDVEWDEDGTGVLDLNDYAVDFDDDELEFYVYDTSDEDYISIDSIENGIVNFSSEKDWNGEDWIVFLIVDEEGYATSNEITLKVLPVNDAPKFTGKIENITFDEDTELTDYLDLNDFFSDVDENIISFSVIGNTFINVILDNGLVSFIPDSNWFGSENIIFSASDGEYNIDSNEITLTVNDANEPPEFGEINCSLNIDEDTEYSCILNASDFENDELSFSVADEDNLECSIDENELTYTSKTNYNGEASCMIEVSDENDYDEYLLEVNVLHVNDAPEIKYYSPSGTPKLMENTNQIFTVGAFDIDGDSLEIRWFLNDVEIANGALYTFNEEKGNYTLTVSVTDSIAEPVTKIWNIFAGDISDFTCQEVGGHKIGDNEVCSGSLLATSDSNLLTCCSIPGSPKFSDAGRCSNLSSGLKLKIENPDENDKLMIEEVIKGKIKIENNLDEDLDFDVNAYLYDISTDNEIENYEDSVSVDENKDEELEFELAIPEDTDEKNNYAVFVKIIDEDERYCNEDYVKIGIEREKYAVVIKKAEIDSAVTCGDYFNAEVKVSNMGSKDDDVYIVIENPGLNISEKSEEFELEKYDEDDTETKTFRIKTSENTNEGNYEIKITAFFDGGNEEYSVTKDLHVECRQIETEIETKALEKISLNTNTAQTQTKDNKNIIILGIMILIVLIAVIISLNIYSKRRENDY